MHRKNHRSRYSVNNKAGRGRASRRRSYLDIKEKQASLDKAAAELEKAVNDLREHLIQSSNSATEESEKEHFRPFIEERLGHPVTLDNILMHPRLNTLVAKEELLAELKAALEDIENESEFDLTDLLGWEDNEDPGPPKYNLFEDDHDSSLYKTMQMHPGSAKVWAFKKLGGHIRRLEYINEPNDVRAYAAVCDFLGKRHYEIEWEYEDPIEGFDCWDNFALLIDEGVWSVANLQLANQFMREMRKAARDAGEEFYWNIATSRESHRFHGNDLHLLNGKWIRYYVKSASPNATLETADLTQYVNYIPVDDIDDERYYFDYTPWNKLYNGRINRAAPGFGNSVIANKKKRNNKNDIVVTAHGHDRAIDKITVSLFDAINEDDKGDTIVSNAEKHCDAINRLGYQLTDSWATAEIVRENVSVFADSFLFPNLDTLSVFNDRDIQKIIKEIDSADLAVMLKTRPKLKDKIQRNMTKKANAMLEEDIEYMGPVSKSRVIQSEEKIKALIRRLNSEGEINFDDPASIEE